TRIPALVRHAAGGIDEQMRLEVRLFLIFLDIIAIRFTVGPPVNVADLVAGIILAMLGELDRKALVRTFMPAGEEAPDQVAPNHRKMAVLGRRGRIELPRGG